MGEARLTYMGLAHLKDNPKKLLEALNRRQSQVERKEKKAPKK